MTSEPFRSPRPTSRCHGVSPHDEIAILEMLRSAGSCGHTTAEVADALFPESPPGYERMVHRHALAALRNLEAGGLVVRSGRRWAAV